MNNERIDQAREYAQNEFWTSISKAFPEIKTGDLDVQKSNEFNVACDVIIRHWYQNNLVGCHTPSATYYALKQLREEFPSMTWEDTSYGNDASDSMEAIINGSTKVRVWMQNPDNGDYINDFGITVMSGDEDKPDDDHLFEDFQQVIAFIRKTYAKPRKPILWKVFDVKDTEGIKKDTGMSIGHEIEVDEIDRYIFFSSQKNYHVIQNNVGLFRTYALNETILGTLEECVGLIERTLGEEVE